MIDVAPGYRETSYITTAEARRIVDMDKAPALRKNSICRNFSYIRDNGKTLTFLADDAMTLVECCE